MKNACLHEAFERIANQFPKRIAVQCNDQKIDYENLNNWSNALARHINAVISGRENFVGIFMERSIEFIVALLAIVKSGNAYVPIDSDTLNPGHNRFPKNRLSFMLEDADISLVITKEAYSQYWDGMSLNIFNMENSLEQYQNDNLSINISSDNMIYGIYTSGSTGYPKLTMVNHSSVMNLFNSIDKYIFSYADKNRQINTSMNAPFGFDASVQQLIGLLNGYCITIIPEKVRSSAMQIIKYINDYRVNILDCTPSQLKLLLDENLLTACSNVLQLIICGGEAIPQNMWQRLNEEKKIAIFNVYGPTECTVDSTYFLINGRDKKDVPTIGRPIDNTEIFICDENGQEVSDGVVGEIYIAGAGVARGYYKRPELNQEHFIENAHTRLYRTGDLGRREPDGNIECLGRMDDQVKIRSHRIELYEIMSILQKHPCISESLVTTHIDDDYAVLLAFIKTKDGITLNAVELSEFLSDYVPEYMIPNQFFIVSEWPLTNNGKIDKKNLIATYLTERNIPVGGLPKTKMEKELADIIKPILKVEDIGINDSFMALGGDSLRVMTLLAEIYKEYDIEVDFTEFFLNPTIYHLIEIIETR
ncbi:hypothetical protein FACS1894105_11980 [Clostridia bacterium]|nr:hypothetical protein FACS1894105_11980 [Clostridia bacterium]